MDWLEELDTDMLLEAIEQQLQSDFPALSVQQLFTQLLSGQLELDFLQLGQQLIQLLWQSATAQFSLLGQLVLLAIAFAVLKQLEGSFSHGNVQKISGLVIQAIAVLLILQSGRQVLEYAQQAVTGMTELMELLLPLQLVLMVGLGNVKTAGLLQPSLMFIVQLAAFFFQHILLPLITMELLLKLVNSFSDTYRLSSLASFLRKVILTSISFSIMLFLAVLSIQGISGQALDSIIATGC